MTDMLFFVPALLDMPWIQPVAAWLLTYALHSTLFLGVAWALARVCTGALAHDALWKTALLAGVVTASVQVAVPANSIGATSTPDTPQVVAPQVMVRSEVNGQPIELQADIIVVQESAEGTPLVIERAPRPSELGETAAAPGWSPASLLSGGIGVKGWTLPVSPWVIALVGFWLIGVVMESLRRVRSHRRFMNRISGRKPVASSALVVELDALAQRAGIRYPLALSQTSALAVPVALGVDEVVLPRWAVEDASREQQRAMMAHEVAHLARRDPFWLAVFAVMESVFFFQPLNHLARRRQQAVAERLCDAWAADAATPLAMARCLVDAGARLRTMREQGGAGLPHLVPGMANGSTLGDRVECLIDARDEPGRRWPALLALSLLVGLMLTAGPSVTSAAQPLAAPPAVPAPPVSLARPAASVGVPTPPPPPPAPTSFEGSASDTSRAFTYTRNDENARMRVEQQGTVFIARDGTLTTISDDGRLFIEETLPTVTRRYEARAGAEGRPVEVYEVNGAVQSLGADARRWLRDRYDEATSQKPPPPPHPPLPPGVSVMPGTGDTFTYTSTTDRRRLHIEQEGRVTYEDGLPVALSEGGRLFIEEEESGKTRRYEARTEASGAMKAVYAVDGATQTLDDGARYWLLRRIEEMQRLQGYEPRTSSGRINAEEYDRQWAAYGQRMDAYAREMEAYAARVDTAGVGQVYDDAHRQYMADYASRMERLAAEMALVHGQAFEEQMADFGSETEVWGRVYGERMRAQAARLAQLAEEAAQSQDDGHRAELVARTRELASVQIPSMEEQSTAQRLQAVALLEEVQRLRHDADRLRYGSESGPVRGTLRSGLQDVYTLGFPLREGSVRVRAGDTDLVEGTDYTVDYDTGTVRLPDRPTLTPGQNVEIDFERRLGDGGTGSSP